MAISRKDVEYAASLARLELTETEADLYTEQLSSFLDYTAVLEELDTDKVPPTIYAVSLHNVMREDSAGAAFERKKALQNAPDAEDGFFRVPRII